MTDNEMFDTVYDMIIRSSDLKLPDTTLTRNGFVPIPKKLKVFYCELDKLCKEYGVSISHEDSQGGFEIEEYDVGYMNWLMDASISPDVMMRSI